MGDTKSRYEIVEGLTQQKQRLIDEKAAISNDQIKMAENIKQRERDTERQKEDIDRNFAREKTDLESNLEAFNKVCSEKEIIINLKIESLKEAIEAIKSISANNEKSA